MLRSLANSLLGVHAEADRWQIFSARWTVAIGLYLLWRGSERGSWTVIGFGGFLLLYGALVQCVIHHRQKDKRKDK